MWGALKDTKHVLGVGWIGVTSKMYRFLGERGRHASIESIRKWMQPHFPWIEERIDELLSMEEFDRLVRNAIPEGEWQPAVAISQIFFLLERDRLKESLQMLLKVWEENPVNFSSLLTEIRKRVISLGKPDISIIETISFDPSKTSYFSPDISNGGVDFFLNYMRFEEGVDVDRVVNSLKELLEREQLVEEFLRLCDIDAPAKAEVFLEKVERGVDILSKAREQGLDVGMIIKRWDEKANEGGERFQYLEDAVKEVADEEVRRRFWREVEEAVEALDIPVVSFSREFREGFVEQAISLGMALIDRDGIKLSDEMKRSLGYAYTVVAKVDPSVLYPMKEVINILHTMMMDAKSPKEVEMRLKILSLLSPLTIKLILGEKEYLEHFKDIISKTVMRGLKEETLVEALEEVIRRRPTAATFYRDVMQSLHREEGI